MINGMRVVPAEIKGGRKRGSRIRERLRRKRVHEERRPKDNKREISEVFSMDDEDYADTDQLIEHVLKRGSIKGKSL